MNTHSIQYKHLCASEWALKIPAVTAFLLESLSKCPKQLNSIATASFKPTREPTNALKTWKVKK